MVEIPRSVPMAEMNFANARDPELLRRMQEHAQEGTCHLCPDGFKKHDAPIIHEANHWFITANDRPYPGSVHHYLIASKRHVSNVSELLPEEWAELQTMPVWLAKHLDIPGFSFFVRSGDMRYTGATLDHMHFHFLVGEMKSDSTQWLLVTLAYKK